MTRKVREVYQFESFVLDADDRLLTRNGKRIRLSPKTIDLLLTLLRSDGRLVTKHDLLASVWPETFVEEGILAVHVSQLRKALGAGNHFVETVARSGYRWTYRARPSSASVHRSAQVHELIGMGRGHLLAATPQDAQQAVAAFRQAVALDASYAAAQGGLALAWCAEAQFRTSGHNEAYPKAKTAALAALRLDEFCADAWAALGSVLFLSEWNWLKAEESLRHALEFASNHSEAYLVYGQLTEALGRLEEGLRLKQKALENYPSSPLAHLQIALSYWHQRRYEDSLQWARKTLDLDPHHLLARELMAGTYKMMGNFHGYMRELLSHFQDFGASPEVVERFRKLYAQGGRIAVTQHMIERVISANQPSMSLSLAILYADLGNCDASFEQLSRTLDSRDPSLVHLAVAPQWDPLRQDGRFFTCLSRMGLDQVMPVMASGRSAS